MQRLRPVGLCLALLLGACGDEEGPQGATSTSVTTAPVTTASPTTTAPPLPGERVDIYPYEGALGDAGFWSEITVEGKTGWASIAFLSQLGQVTDITAALFPTPADRPTAPTMLELGRRVAARRDSDEPPSRIVVVDGPSVGDFGEITVDVLGLGDDAQGGERLKIFGEPGPGGGSFTVRSVEATALCTRGVTSGGLCT